MTGPSKDYKLFSGRPIRRLRRELGLTQARMAEELGISTSYLNLLERNQRPVTAQILVRLAEAYDVDLRSFAGNEEANALASLNEVFSDPLFASHPVDQQELKEVAEAGPEVAQAVIALYQAYRRALTGATELAGRLTDRDGPITVEALRDPAEEVRDFLRARNNHFPELEAAAEALHDRARLAPDELYSGLKAYLAEALDTGCALMPVDLMPSLIRSYDRHRRRVLLSEALAESGRAFQLAFQIALLEHGTLLDRLAGEAGFPSPETRRLARINLASYFAAAVMMPYDRFLRAAEALRYDIDLLCRRFSASFEQVCHRLTTLQRPGARGVPFFMIRIDSAGNVSKRFSAGSFQFARLGGACPRWNLHAAFQTPGRILTQIVQMPDGARYFSIARTVARPGLGHAQPDRYFAIALGCEIAYAGRLAYADGQDLAQTAADMPIGINCRLCERPDCDQRAFPPLNRPLIVDENRRDLSPFLFAAG